MTARRRGRRLIALLFGVAACNTGGPTEPTLGDLPGPAGTLSPGTVLRVVSGESGEPVSSAKIVVAGRERVAGPDGRVTLDADVPLGATIDVLAAGFLERQTSARPGTTTYELWPSESDTGLDRNFTRSIVYTSAAVGSSDSEPLDRPSLDNPDVAVLPDAAIRNDSLAMASLRAASAEMTDALGGSLVYRVGERAGAVPMSLRVDPGDETIRRDNLRAFTRCWMNRLVIIRCEVVFRSVEIVRSATALHELGHTFGLNHSSSRSEIMGVRRLSSPDSFSPRERLVMRLMMKRRPGNLFPDNDRQAPTQRASGITSRVVCRHPD